MERKIWYEPHPVSADRKAELRAKGYTIVDAKFDPESATEQSKNIVPVQTYPDLTRTDLARMKKADMQALCMENGLEVMGSNDDLRARLAEHLFE